MHFPGLMNRALELPSARPPVEGVVLFNGMAGRAGMISDKSLMGNATFFAICSMRNGDESAMINVQNSSSELNNNCGMRARPLSLQQQYLTEK